MDQRIKEELLSMVDDLTPLEAKRLIYYCLECSQQDIARRAGVTRQAVSHSFISINNKIAHENHIRELQTLLSKRGFLL